MVENRGNLRTSSRIAAPKLWGLLAQARLARRPAKAEAAPREVEDDFAGEMTDATFDERMRAKVSTPCHV